MTFLIALLLCPVVIVTACFAIECLIGLFPARLMGPGKKNVRTAVIVVPAHDEAKTIAATLSRLKASASGLADILVVADNCEDDTALIARQCGVRVVERADRERRGKGFALALAQQELQHNPPEVVVVIDADCRLDRSSLAQLIGSAAASRQPVQAIYLLATTATTPPMVQISNFAFMLRNLVRQRGLQRLAGSVHLTGSGMAFPWPIYRDASLATANIVEDVKLGLELANRGTAPILCPTATVWSDASSAEGTLRQRERWEGGFLTLVGEAVPMALGAAAHRRDPRLLLRAVDLCVPPLVLLMTINVTALLLVTAVTYAFRAEWWPVAIQIVTLTVASVAIVMAWATKGRGLLSASALARVPLYLLWKLPMYLRLTRGGAGEWLRTGR